MNFQTNNKDDNIVRDGSIVDFSDKISPMIEAYLAINNDINNKKVLYNSINLIKDKYKNKKLYNINIDDIIYYFAIDK